MCEKQNLKSQNGKIWTDLCKTMQPEVFTRELERDVCKTTWRELEMMKVTAYKKKKEKSERISGQNHQESFKSKGNSDHIPKASRQLGGIAPSKTLQSSLPAEEMNYMGWQGKWCKSAQQVSLGKYSHHWDSRSPEQVEVLKGFKSTGSLYKIWMGCCLSETGGTRAGVTRAGIASTFPSRSEV